MHFLEFIIEILMKFNAIGLTKIWGGARKYYLG